MRDNAAKPKTYPFTLRLTAEQRTLLEHKAGKRPLGAYLRAVAINDNEPGTQKRSLYPIKDQKVANQLLGELGRSRIAENLTPLAQAAKTGAFVLTEKESAVLISACADIAAMRRLLMRALGHRSAANDH